MISNHSNRAVIENLTLLGRMEGLEETNNKSVGKGLKRGAC